MLEYAITGPDDCSYQSKPAHTDFVGFVTCTARLSVMSRKLTLRYKF